MKTLLIDIETFPNQGRAWGFYEQNLLWPLIKHWEICAFAAKWYETGEKISLTRYDHDEAELLIALQDLLDQADIVVAHNGDGFDLKKINTRMFIYGLGPPNEYRTVDTCKACKRIFGFTSNKLDHVCQQLGIGKKIRTPGIDLWTGCEEGDPKSWALMQKYNIHDVKLLEGLYERLVPWLGQQPKPVRVKEVKLIQNA